MSRYSTVTEFLLPSGFCHSLVTYVTVWSPSCDQAGSERALPYHWQWPADAAIRRLFLSRSLELRQSFSKTVVGPMSFVKRLWNAITNPVSLFLWKVAFPELKAHSELVI